MSKVRGLVSACGGWFVFYSDKIAQIGHLGNVEMISDAAPILVFMEIVLSGQRVGALI
jgi:hypothetical protein